MAPLPVARMRRTPGWAISARAAAGVGSSRAVTASAGPPARAMAFRIRSTARRVHPTAAGWGEKMMLFPAFRQMSAL